MSGYKTLLEVCQKFEKELQLVSEELYSVTTASFEDTIEKRVRDLTLLRTKLKLLRAKPLSLNPQVIEENIDEDTVIGNYGNEIESRIIEELLVKSGAQAHAVERLLTAPENTLEPDMIQKKEKIIAALSAYQKQEKEAQYLDMILGQKGNELASVMREWDSELAMLKDSNMKKQTTEASLDNDHLAYRSIWRKVNKLQKMCWLLGLLTTAPSDGYDWMRDPQNRLQLLKMARKQYTVDTFLRDTS